jgi:two-component system, OmpR family, sensor histidine kinase SenX3
MTKTPSARVIVLGIIALGLLATGGAMLELQSVFLAEHQRDLNALKNNKLKIQAYTKRAYASSLAEDLDTAIENMSKAIEDPLLYRPNYFWREDNRQYFPLGWEFSKSETYTSEYHYTYLMSSASQDNLNTQWPEELQLLWRTHKAVIDEDPDAIDFHIKELLRHMARNRLQANYELALRISLVEIFGHYKKSSPNLISMLVREGISDGSGNAIAGLQRDIIWRRNKLSRESFSFLRRKILEISKLNNVPHDDFESISRSPLESERDQWPNLNKDGGPLIWKNAWYIERRGNADVGITINPKNIMKEVSDEMLSLGLLGEGESVILLPISGDKKEIRALSFRWDSDKWQKSKQDLDQFYRIKQRVLIGCVVIVIGVIILTWLIYQRQQRWVGIKSEFVATVSHEIRTPLSAIRLMAERLMNRLNGDDKARDYPQRIIADIDTLSFLVDNILSYERLNSGQWIAHHSPLSLREMVEDLRKELPLYSKTPFSIEVESEGDVVVYGDPVLIKLLFMNLAKNSCSYNEHECAVIKIKWQGSGGACIHYIDNGVGFADNEVKDCFEPFYRGESQRHTRGSGLGLALCKNIARLHGGAITIDSTGPSGTHFIIEFKDGTAND